MENVDLNGKFEAKEIKKNKKSQNCLKMQSAAAFVFSGAVPATGNAAANPGRLEQQTGGSKRANQRNENKRKQQNGKSGN